MPKVDKRPICTCPIYDFPHKIGGRCKGDYFTEMYMIYQGRLCVTCNNNSAVGQCDVTNGAEDIQTAECYQEAVQEEHKYLIIQEPWK